MGKYIVDQNSTVISDIYIDTRGITPSVIPDRCQLVQGLKPCDGDATKGCNQKYEKCNASSKSLCGDKLGKIRSENDGNIPEGIVKESATWKRESWSISNRIENDSLVLNTKTNEKEFDFVKLIDSRIKYLLKGWTLDRTESDLKLIFTTDQTGVEYIRPEVMVNIGKVSRDIIHNIYRSGRDKLENTLLAGDEAKN